jgi:pyruvate dehydrogenase E1 component beta subunit
MVAAIRDENPVLFIEPMSLSHSGREEVPEDLFEVPIGSARVVRPGRHLTLVAIGSMVPVAGRVGVKLQKEGIELEVIDLRSLRPWDSDAVLDSVRKTGCLVTVQESWVAGGFASEIVSTVVERGLDDLMAPVVRVGSAPVPIPSGPLRKYALPDEAAIEDAVRAVLRSSGR